MDEHERGTALLLLARAAIAHELGLPSPPLPERSGLEEDGAAFVTLDLHSRLRGCIGSLEAHRPLFEDVRHNAVAAAFMDPRFPPLSEAEFAQVTIEVSVLSTPQRLEFHSESEALAQLRPGKDGVILKYGQHRATFLPQVWEQLNSPDIFMSHLKEKAGLPADFWSDELALFRYSVVKYREGA